MKKILCVFGTRPEAIKMAPVILALRKYPQTFRVRIVLTAQHRKLLDQVLALFKLRSNHDLNIMRADQSLTNISVKALKGLELIFRKEDPDLVLVHGDTTSTAMAALAAFYQKIPVGHVEAGLRTHNPYLPFPEELNRRLADQISSLHLAPTILAKEHLRLENISPKNIFVTGNTAIDALKWGIQKFRKQSVPFPPKPFVLVTVHRRESFGAPLREICWGIQDVARKFPRLFFLIPAHPNPHVLGFVRTFFQKNRNIF